MEEARDEEEASVLLQDMNIGNDHLLRPRMMITNIKIDPDTGEETCDVTYTTKGLSEDQSHYCDNCNRHEFLLGDGKALFPCTKCGLAEWCSAQCQKEHITHAEECTAAQERQQLLRKKSRKHAEKFDVEKFRGCVAAGWKRRNDDVRNAIIKLADVWANDKQDAVLLYTNSSRPDGRFLPVKFVGEATDAYGEQARIELFYVNSLATEEKAELFLCGDAFKKVGLSKETFEAIADELLVRNNLLREANGDIVHDFRVRRPVHVTYLMPREWKVDWEANHGADNGKENPDPLDGPLPTPPPGVSCWICLEDGVDKNGQPLRRDCSCRGSSGYGHYECIYQYTRQRYERAWEESHDKADCRKVCEYCPNCQQKYGRRLAYELARSFADLESSRAESDNRRLLTQVLLGKKCVEQRMFQDARKVLESSIKVLRSQRQGVVDPLECDALMYLGGALQQDGDLVNAFKVFEEARQFFIREEDPMLHRVEGLIDELKQSVNHSRAGLGTLQLSTKIREDLVRSKGEAHYETIHASIGLGKSLYDVGEVLDAQKLLTETAELAKRTLGPQHGLTDNCEQCLAAVSKRMARLFSENTNLNEKLVEVLRLTKDGSKYIIQFEDGGEMKKAKVPPGKLLLTPDTPVICLGMMAGKVKGYDPKNGLHMVELADGGADAFPPEVVRVVFK